MDTNSGENERLFPDDADWNHIKGRMRDEYSSITDEDFEFMEHNEAEFINRLEQKTGKTKSQIRRWVHSMSRIM